MLNYFSLYIEIDVLFFSLALQTFLLYTVKNTNHAVHAESTDCEHILPPSADHNTE